MKLSGRQQGNVGVVLLIVLVVALIGVLGYAFWYHSRGNAETAKTTATTKTDAATSDTYTQRGSITLAGHTLTVNYPEGWKIEKMGPTGGGDQQLALLVTSPSGEYTADFSLLTGGLGGTCAQGRIVSSSVSPMVNVSGAKLFEVVVKGSTTNDAGYFTEVIVVNSDTDTSKLRVGGDSCDIFLNRYFLPDGHGIGPTSPIAVNVQVTGLAQTDNPSKQVAADSLKTDEYLTLKHIVLNLQLK